MIPCDQRHFLMVHVVEYDTVLLYGFFYCILSYNMVTEDFCTLRQCSYGALVSSLNTSFTFLLSGYIIIK